MHLVLVVMLLSQDEKTLDRIDDLIDKLWTKDAEKAEAELEKIGPVCARRLRMFLNKEKIRPALERLLEKFWKKAAEGWEEYVKREGYDPSDLVPFEAERVARILGDIKIWVPRGSKGKALMLHIDGTKFHHRHPDTKQLEQAFARSGAVVKTREEAAEVLYLMAALWMPDFMLKDGRLRGEVRQSGSSWSCAAGDFVVSFSVDRENRIKDASCFSW